MKVKIENNVIYTDQPVTEENMSTVVKKLVAYVKKNPEKLTPEVQKEIDQFTAAALSINILKGGTK